VRATVLDHGYIEVVESWGSDERIIEAARMSTAKGFQGWGDDAAPGDEKLLRFLWQNKHATPFEMAGLTVEVQAPIFVFREWHRHRTQSYNEMSARYTPLPDLNYVPDLDRCMVSGGTNKQAGKALGALQLTEGAADDWLAAVARHHRETEALYQRGLEIGLPKEVARIVLPVARYSRMRASANLRNWLAFLTLRQASGAQWEIRQYADALGKIVGQCFPRTWAIYQTPDLSE
jgi:thymidylate synthase (FAD)